MDWLKKLFLNGRPIKEYSLTDRIPQWTRVAPQSLVQPPAAPATAVTKPTGHGRIPEFQGRKAQECKETGGADGEDFIYKGLSPISSCMFSLILFSFPQSLFNAAGSPPIDTRTRVFPILWPNGHCTRLQTGGCGSQGKPDIVGFLQPNQSKPGDRRAHLGHGRFLVEHPLLRLK